VAIVRNAGEVGPDGGGWAVSAQPLLSIGTFQGDSLQQLFQVEGALRLADGRFVLANAGSGELRVYAADGTFLASHGRKGEGPGEFQLPALAGRVAGDTLLVVDVELRRISLLHPDAGFLESVPVSDQVGGALYPLGMFEGGAVMVGGGFYWSGHAGDRLADGYTRPPTSYRSISRRGELAVDFGEFPGSEFFMKTRTSAEGHMMMAARLIPFGCHPMAAMTSSRFFFGSGDSWEVKVFGSGGELERIVRWDRPSTPVTGDDVEAYIEQAVADASDATRAPEIRQDLSALPVPDALPAFAGLRADSRGYLWVERSRTPGDPTPVHDILDLEGRVVGWVALPEELEILEIGPDYLLGLHRDELEVEYLRVYGVTRPAARG
jgi:hypothetical protein